MNYERKNSGSTKFWSIIYLIVILSIPVNTLLSQGRLASPANWLYPDGNSEGTKKINVKSQPQIIEEFQVKWASDTIAGDLKPLIGNIIFNESLLPGFPFGPNEMTAVIGGNIVVVDATGKTHKMSKLPPFARDVSVLFDTLQNSVNPNITNGVCLGIETVESENLKDSLAFAYVCSYDGEADTIAILKRLAVDLRLYKPNIFGSIRPVFGKSNNGINEIYALVNMSQPEAVDPAPVLPSYFRGLAQFNSDELKSFYPLNDIGDDIDSRTTLGYQVSFAQPSISMIEGGNQRILLPSFPSDNIDVMITNPVTMTQTYSNLPYLLSMDMNNTNLQEDFGPILLSDYQYDTDTRPQYRPYFVNIYDAAANDSVFILLAEEYRGTEGSNGISKLHLFDKSGTAITFTPELISGSGLTPSFVGIKDHLWSVAIGNVDGNSSNSLLPSYPNNRGNEILVTESTREFVVPNNRLIVLRYNSGPSVPKKSPPNMFLNQFDTICTQRINGWLAAVNDIDGANDNKDEIFIVEGSRLHILRMNDYESYEFRDGRYFDTVDTFQFQDQTIQNVAIADLEGDGKNDIIITTNDRTYLIGSKIFDVIDMLYPKNQETPPQQFCVNDTIPVTWKNVYFRDRDVRHNDTLFSDIYFRPYENGFPLDTMILLLSRIENELDTVTYNFVVNSKVFGLEGRFIIVGSDSTGMVIDSSAVISFKYPGVLIDDPSTFTYHSNETLFLSGSAFCLDSVTMEYSYDNSNWTIMNAAPILENGTYIISGDMPCAPYYDCILPDMDSIINVIVVAHKETYSDTSQVIPINLLPEVFPYVLAPCETACPTREFTWDVNDIENNCDSVIISIADISSNTFSYIDKISVTDGHYSWNIPVNVPEWIKVRICCENSCVRLDTVLFDIKASYIGIVSPNPFKPVVEEASITYRVPGSTYVTVRILDQAERLVKEIINGEPRQPDIVYCEKWDGRIWDGSLAANGMYYVSVELSDGQRDIYPIYVRK